MTDRPAAAHPTPGTPPALQIADLTVAYGEVEAVRGVSLTVAHGTLVAMIGANGAGKSTTLAAASGLVRPRRGSILLDGEDITGWRSSKRVAAGLVQVPEGREVLATMTVEENLRLGAWHQRDRLAEGLDEAFTRFPVLGDRRRAQAGTLSGGEQQMLAIARALLARPRVLLLDEPSMGLAPKLVDEVFDVIRSIREDGTTVLLVEQNAHRALAAADHAYVLETGEVVLEGPAAELRSNTRVIEAYLGETFTTDTPPDPT